MLLARLSGLVLTLVRLVKLFRIGSCSWRTRRCSCSSRDSIYTGTGMVSMAQSGRLGEDESIERHSQ